MNTNLLSETGSHPRQHQSPPDIAPDLPRTHTRTQEGVVVVDDDVDDDDDDDDDDVAVVTVVVVAEVSFVNCGHYDIGRQK
ncbi:hypothetical protein E2C01_096772 [Portunus trituberculatus]|uniref:Uncharacterized protein n=1 Tax=Portunus trituberculatus TaxID=210409 RepID=A0A5B7JYR7_PORTR|nr:hypothetical protein [Portunus trituberculatus]